jgi:plastocyanin
MFETRPLAVIAALFAGTAANAADLDVQIRAPNGGPVRDAVVTLHLARQPTPAPKIGSGYAIDQQDIQFHPLVTVVPAGASVAFTNHDPVRHHVYSFSEAKRFELKVNERQVNRVVAFDKPGIVPLGCNIHDRMIAFIDVVDTPWAAKTDANGNVSFRGVPATGVTIDVWHPYLRAPGNRVSRAAALAQGPARRESFTVALRNPPRPPDAGY